MVEHEGLSLRHLAQLLSEGDGGHELGYETGASCVEEEILLLVSKDDLAFATALHYMTWSGLSTTVTTTAR